MNNHTSITKEKEDKMIAHAKNRCTIVMGRINGIEELKERKIKLEGRKQWANGITGDYDYFELIEINKILNTNF